MIELLQEYALRFVGLPYRWGGDDPINGFDCSGLVQELLASVGMDPPGDQNAQGLFEHFLPSSHREVRGAGALAFYGITPEKITHVAMFIDHDTVIEAGGGGSKTLTREDAAAQNAFIRLRPYNHRKDLVAVLMPTYLERGA
jgi:cell wall-associated NlpC family hydrolase